MLARQCFTRCRRVSRVSPRSWSRTQSTKVNNMVGTDACGIPLQPTWSVNDLLSSYPIPTITSATFKRLHELSALLPPAEGTEEHDKLKQELEDLVKLVEAVKLVDLSAESRIKGGIPDGRICAEGTSAQPADFQVATDGEVVGADLLRYGARTADGLYMVDSDRNR